MQRQAMQVVPSASDADDREAARLAALDRYDILDTPREEAFDRLVRLARRIFDVPVAIVSVIDAHRQWYKAFEGMSDCEVGRRDSFCNFTIDGGGQLIVPDTTLDPRFQQNRFVLQEPGVRFYAGVPLRTTDGHAIGTLCIVDFKPRAFTAENAEMLADLGMLAMSEFELRRLAAVDHLTGVMSRRAFKDAGARDLSRALRAHESLACISIDLDHFKRINDGHGHAAGDAALAAAMHALKPHLREGDLLGRLGGEEFAVLMPQTDRAGAVSAAERFREAIEAIQFVADGQRVPITASLGVATLNASTKELDGLLARADQALYEAKLNGRNRVVACDNGNGGAGAGRRVLKAGVILFNNRNSTIDCTVRTLSDTGAGLDVSSTAGIPHRFSLRIKIDGFETPCRIVGRTDRHLDVAFD